MPKKVAYLFGAGATIGEWQYAAGENGEKLSLKSVSESAISKAKETAGYNEILSEVNADDITDIELFISLLESIHTKKFSDLVGLLRSLFCIGIQENLMIRNAPIEPK